MQPLVILFIFLYSSWDNNNFFEFWFCCLHSVTQDNNLHITYCITVVYEKVKVFFYFCSALKYILLAVHFFCPNHTLMLPTFSLSIDRRGKRQIVRETGGQDNPCMPSAPFNFLSLFHSILCALARSDKPPNSLAHSSLLFSFVHPVQLCAPLFIPQTAHHWREPLPKSHCPTRTPSLHTHTHTRTALQLLW